VVDTAERPHPAVVSGPRHGRVDADEVFRAWAAWNSLTRGANADLDPIAKKPLGIQQNVPRVDVPDTAKPILGKDAQLRFTVKQRD
jgi:hypothetical protein